MGSQPLAPPPETKDWTFVVDRPCEQCRFDASDVDVHGGLGDRIVAAASELGAAATAAGGTRRPAPLVWSPLEYAAHARDVCSVFGARVELMRRDDGARFANWDQDAAAIEGRYWELDPLAVRAELAAGAAAAADRFAALTAGEWSHRGLRSNGSAFTCDSLARYFLHDLEHHVDDVSR